MTDIVYFTEIGIGNDHFIETEIEQNGTETRQKGFVRMKIVSFYLRLWIGHTIYVLGMRDGFVRKAKDRKKFKLLIGFEGVPR